MDGIVNGEERLRGVEQGLAYLEKSLSVLEATLPLRREQVDQTIDRMQHAAKALEDVVNRTTGDLDRRVRALEEQAIRDAGVPIVVKSLEDDIDRLDGAIADLKNAPAKGALATLKGVLTILTFVLGSFLSGWALHAAFGTSGGASHGGPGLATHK